MASSFYRYFSILTSIFTNCFYLNWATEIWATEILCDNNMYNCLKSLPQLSNAR